MFNEFLQELRKKEKNDKQNKKEQVSLKIGVSMMALMDKFLKNDKWGKYIFYFDNDSHTPLQDLLF
jgi:hypothetical protein